MLSDVNTLNQSKFSLINKIDRLEKKIKEYFNLKFGIELKGNEIKINLNGKNIGNIGFNLFTALEFKNLEEIDLSNNNISNIEALKDFSTPKLKKIDLSHNKISDIKVLKEISQEKNELENINLKNNLIKDFTILKECKFPKIKEITLDEKNIIQKDIEEIKNSITNKSINDEINENELADNSTIANNLGGKNEITTITQKNIKIIKCPKCVSNDCIVNLKNYKVLFYGCKFGHTCTAIYGDYSLCQKDDLKEIICISCKGAYNKSFLEFYRCFTCSEMFGQPRYFCNKCKSKHNKKHIKVKYDEQNYYCNEHIINQANKLIKYCFTCKKNLCEECKCSYSTNQKHIIKDFQSISPNLEELKYSLNKIKENIDDVEYIICYIKEYLDDALNIFIQYYKITKDIISKYELLNQDLRNYRILKTLRNLEFSNNQILKDLNSIIEENNIKDKADFILDLFFGDRIKEDNYNEDNDETCEIIK